MTLRVVGSALLTFVLMLAWWATSIGSVAMQQKGATSKAPESRPWPPRTPDGQPDIQGYWGSVEGGMYSLNLESVNHLSKLGMPRMGVRDEGGSTPMDLYARGGTIVVDPPTGIIPYQPWALERRNSVMKEYNQPKAWQFDTQTPGWMVGIPRAHVYSSWDNEGVGHPWQILQGPGYVLFLYEVGHAFRYVPLDGRPQPGKDINLWMGSSRGRWEGNTLIIETTNNNDSPRLSVVGDFRSDEMRVTERFTFVDQDTLAYRATIEDSKVFTRPWTIAQTNKRSPAGWALLEYAGVEGDLNVAVATGQTIEPK